jgi:hypothetical protein
MRGGRASCSMAAPWRTQFDVPHEGTRATGSGAARGRGDATRFLGSATVMNVTPGTIPNPEHDSADIRQVIPNVFCRCGAQPIVPALPLALVGCVTADARRHADALPCSADRQGTAGGVGDWLGGATQRRVFKALGAASALVMLRRGCGADHIHNPPRTRGCADRASRRRKAEVHQTQ